MKVLRFLFLVMFVTAMLYHFSRFPQDQAPSLDPSPPPAKSWQEVGRKILIDRAWEMSSATIWGVEGVPSARDDMRLYLEGSFQAADPGVKLMVGKLGSAGSVPTSVSLGPAFRLPVSQEGYYFGFYPAVHAPDLGSMPNSGLGLAVLAYKVYAASHPTPIHVTAHVELVVESYCIVVEAAKERKTFADASVASKED